ncbi:hypothetical protein [Holospora curviuscula]|uniref:Uncharacterized protein n=1 Tax=Holospora curviuscula TaxID=1082868 RepID=A0A2S5RAD5_9PROT|nr:hypothetical protein [Holospora curviuscula]PPE04296.1 hypothetical protein HCUR_00487 [Holospora curviuscula]
MKNYTCLQDVLDEIYEDEEMNLGQKHWQEAIKKFATKEGLLTALSHYFELWDREERDRDYLQELLSLEGQKASWCFFYLFEALRYLKDPSFIPQVMRYFLPSGKEVDHWEMEDIWTEMMLKRVASYHFGPTYMNWLMRSLHLLHPGARWAASYFIFNMIYHTFYEIKPDKFPDLPVVNALPLGKRDLVLSLLDEKIERYKQSLEEKKKKILNNDPLQSTLRSVESYKEDIAYTEYVRGQLLLLPKEVISIGHR